MIEIVMIIRGGDAMRDMWLLKKPHILDAAKYEYRATFNIED